MKTSSFPGPRTAVRTATRTMIATLSAGALVVSIAGCESSPLAVGPGSGSESTPAPPVSFQTSVVKGAKDVRPDATVTVSTLEGSLHTVTLVGPDGKELRGEVENGTWRLVDMMAPGAVYTLKATGVSDDGTPGSFSRAFTTLKPTIEATYRVTPDDDTVGVGMPVMITFDTNVMTPQMRANVEKQVTVTTTPAQEGSFGWLTDNQLMWRPKEYWKPNTKVSVNAALRGVQTGEKKWVTQDKTAAFTIAKRARVSTVDVGNHVMTVKENGKLVATYPVSSGRATKSWRTRSGTKIITEKRAFMVMDAATLGVPKDDPNYYRTEVNYAMRVTNTGEFLHSAPWSVWAQGRRNVSHGCVNMGPRDAKQMFNASLPGDVVDFVNSPRKMKPTDGVGVWLFDYAQWQARSALYTPPKTPAPTPSATPSGTPSAATTPSAASSTAAAPDAA